MRKKLFTLLLAIGASIGIVNAVDVTQNGINYSLYETGYYSIERYAVVQPPQSGNKYSGDIVIASSISYGGNYYTTTGIWHKAFQNCKDITSVNLPNTIKNIYDQAFDGCTGITSIDIPSSVTYIGYNAFNNVPNINFTGNASGSMGQSSPWGALYVNKYTETPLVYENANKNKVLRCATSASGDIYLPNTVKSIEQDAFYKCSQLTSIHLPSSVNSIGSRAFQYCSNATIYTNTLFILFDKSALYYDDLLENPLNILEDNNVKNDTNIISCSQYDLVPEFTVIENDNFVTKAFTVSGDYTFTSIAKTPATIHLISNRNIIQLPDTTVCYGEWVSLSDTYQYRYVDPFEQSQWSDFYNEFASESFISNFMEDGSQTDYYQWYAFQKYWENYTEIHGECDEQTRQGFETWYKSHFHDYASSCPEGVEYVRVSSDGERFYSSRTLIRTYTNSHGCDSTVSRNVIVSKAVAPKIIATPEQDTFNSGTIRIYNKYCTGSEYYDDQYNYIYKNAEYDYFTINGTKYDFSSAIEGEYNEYYHPDGIRVIDEPSTVIDNLHGGNYHIVFYSACDSVEEYIEIQQYGIEVDGIYYKFQEPYTFSYGGETYEFPGEATVTYRGTSSTEYDEYSGDIVIPESVVLKGVTYIVQRIGNEAFYKCVNLSSITLLGSKCKLSQDYIYTRSDFYYVAYSGIIYGYNDNSAWGSGQVARTTIPIYVPYGSLNFYKEQHPTGTMYGTMNFHIINPHRMTNIISSTTATILFDYENAQHISSCGIDGGEEFAGNVIEHTGLEPNHNYTDVSLFVKTIEGDYDTIHYSFSTTALELTTKPSKTVSSTTAILLAETNMSDAEVSCGFEYKRNDAPADMEGNKVYCPVASGQMAGRLKNLKDDVYYKYRAFYQSAAGNMYYGDWQYIFTGDVAVEFDPILYTYSASIVTETEATLSGYALAGSEDFTEQGFEYWAESRVKGQGDQVPSTNGAPRRMSAALNDHLFAPATGIKMSVTLAGLDEGTVYKYRAYGKVGNQYYYGTEQTFTTQGEWVEEIQGIEEVASDQLPNIKARKILRDGQIFILRGEKVYSITGQEVK